MSALADQLPQLLTDQRRDGLAVDGARLLQARALAAGLPDVAESLGLEADVILARIRVRSRVMADLLDGAEQTIDADATCSAVG